MGCEAYTIAAYLAQSFPSLDWSIDASDISEEALAVARSGRYGREHGLGGPLSDTAATLEKRLFLRDGGCWNVREDIRSRISFKRADVLSEEFSARTGYDAVFGQNFMIHMSAKDEARAFSNLVAVLRDGGVLFAGGMDLDRRIALACSHGLRSVNWRVSAIHDADDMRRSAWPWFYWSLEPINNNSVQSLERYATVYVKHRDD
jgi:SAM-dependent methyltransferase